MSARDSEFPSAQSDGSRHSRHMPARASLAVRQREETHSSTGAKRKRTNTTSAGGASPASTMDDDDLDDVYDPDQPLEERRKVQQGFRDLLRNITEHSEEYLQGDSHGLHETILRANELSKQ
ncbi:hypothetical protein BBK36DRAFT_1164102, partial [Trichoderma citrinoviride]